MSLRDLAALADGQPSDSDGEGPQGDVREALVDGLGFQAPPAPELVGDHQTHLVMWNPFWPHGGWKTGPRPPLLPCLLRPVATRRLLPCAGRPGAVGMQPGDGVLRAHSRAPCHRWHVLLPWSHNGVVTWRRAVVHPTTVLGGSRKHDGEPRTRGAASVVADDYGTCSPRESFNDFRVCLVLPALNLLQCCWFREGIAQHKHENRCCMSHV